jgi:hypothetical protein
MFPSQNTPLFGYKYANGIWLSGALSGVKKNTELFG